MPENSIESRRQLERLDRPTLERFQIQKLNRLLERILPNNAFYANKLGSVGSLTDIRALHELPFTIKQELVPESDSSTWAANLTFMPENYVRFHRTSGTRGQPLVVPDTAADWRWWLETWQFVLDAAEVTAADRAAITFSYGPFIGLWSAHDALAHRGALVIPCGGMSSLARLELICQERVTVLCCTPSYALYLARLARDENIPIGDAPVRAIIVAGEPGGSIPTVRARIEETWQSKVVDHAGATEVGPWGYADARQRGLHVIESEFIAEFLTVQDPRPANDGELAELVLTNLGRAGAPLIRYRTGDLVRPCREGVDGNHFVHFDGGVLGRVDDMMIVRGVNIYPSAIERILSEFPEVQEYRITVSRQGEMDVLSVEVEDSHEMPDRIAQRLRLRLGLKVDVQVVPPNSLPRFELKGSRFIDLRS